MRKFLHHDSVTGELRLVYADLWDGQHERTEYRVMSDRVSGRPLRNLPDFDDEQVHGHAPDLYVKRGPWGERTVPVWAQETPVGPTVKTPCPRAANARRKCSQCSSGE